MSRTKVTVDSGSSMLFSSAQSCAWRAEQALQGLGGASNILLLTGVAAGLVASFLAGLPSERVVSTGADS